MHAVCSRMCVCAVFVYACAQDDHDLSIPMPSMHHYHMIETLSPSAATCVQDPGASHSGNTCNTFTEPNRSDRSISRMEIPSDAAQSEAFRNDANIMLQKWLG